MTNEATSAGAEQPTAAKDRRDGEEPSSEQAGHPAAASLAQLENSQTAIRDTTKWLVAAAAGVGAVLVAGLQLSNLPRGTLASAVAFGGFAIALSGVARVLFSAAGVLSVGYTTLGQLADLYKPESKRRATEEKWNDKKKKVEETARKAPASNRVRDRIWTALRKAAAPIRLWRLERQRRREVEFKEDRGVPIAEMIDYLERDTAVFSNGLAEDISELYRRIEKTDREILEFRGQVPGSGDRREPAEPNPAAASRPATAKETADSEQKLASAEWRAGKLETAAGQLIAFANQKVIEQQFERLKTHLKYGGTAVAVGVALFAGAPKFGPTGLAVDRPTVVTLLVNDPKTFGEHCTLHQLAGVAIGGTWDQPIVVTQPAEGCGGKQLELESSIGLAVPAVEQRATTTTTTRPIPSP